MKIILSLLLAIACTAVLVLGNMHWNDQIKSSVNSSSAAQEEVPQKSVDEKQNPTEDELLSFAGNWPKESQELYKKRLGEKKPFTILFGGSKAMAANVNGWPNAVKGELEKTYGDTVTVKVKQYDLNSMEFVQQDKQQELIDQKADLIIFEPFTLADNGEINNSDTLDNITTIIQNVKAAKKDTTFILQPPHPLYKATFYPQQVNELKNFAKENNITYLDHWTVWPDIHSKELQNFLNKDNESANAKGHEVWALYIEEFLIKK
ncbi:SGNH/GDSL hydrolase family protein [Peribacillus cavernae]|uniref:SGNH/GDSL hydrolase family protein n=1 Tax=Peribacillus cavernae TaxID=1674310 RepID=A0A433HHM1_9BACI|nr:SGNH/GDSL hydrolase family protein [Peribacillus cavernae]MDQ0219254.1 hypothetical protein [Peribacillus cavernae]RUQ27848.1 SGNH/GDSL hydrolase family protein [Peribacillus cavernae]